MPNDLITIRDLRNKAHFLIDDAYLNGYAKKCGIYATGIYMSLCRHADKEQKCWPSIQKIAEELSIGRKSVMIGLQRLEKHGIIKKERVGKKLTNRYTLVDKSYWLSEVDDRHFTSEVPHRDLCSPSQGLPKSLTGTSIERKHNRKETHIRKRPKGRSGKAAPTSFNELKTEPMNEDIDRSFPRKRLYGDETLNWLIDYFEHRFGHPSLDGSEKWSRVFAKHLKTKIGAGKTREVIDWASDPDCWWYSRITGLKMLYYKREQILAAMEEKKPGKEIIHL